MLTVSSSSIGTGGFCTVGVELEKGIWPGSFRGESSGIPKTCKAANYSASKPNLQAWFTTGSAEFSAFANPSLYHFSLQASKATLRSASSSTWVVFKLTASANLRSVLFCFVKSSTDLFSAIALAFSVVAAFFSVVSAAFIFSLAVLTVVFFAALSQSASSISSFAWLSRIWASWVT